MHVLRNEGVIIYHGDIVRFVVDVGTGVGSMFFFRVTVAFSFLLCLPPLFTVCFSMRLIARLLQFATPSRSWPTASVSGTNLNLAPQ